jgi:hypothetical protein
MLPMLRRDWFLSLPSSRKQLHHRNFDSLLTFILHVVNNLGRASSSVMMMFPILFNFVTVDVTELLTGYTRNLIEKE